MRTILPRVQLSVVMSTYNRGELLADAVRSILAQQHADTPEFELIVVDNNSTDGTREVIERFEALDARVRYVFEPQQGSSYGRNAGIRAARAPLIAFTDDDVRAQPDWLASIVRAFDEHPDADVVGGRVLPIWPATPPQWLTRNHWTPLALVDYGDLPVAVNANHPICLVTANCSFRRRIFDAVGLFAPEFGLGKDGILGSVEDQELQLRVMRARRRVLYDPRIIVHAEIQPNRLQRDYHRRWHSGHGHFHALLRSEDMEQTRVGTLFGVPAHLYRQAVGDLIGWARAVVTRAPERAFQHELRLRFFSSFFKTRRREFAKRPFHERLREFRRLLPIPRRGPVTTPARRTRVAGGK
ncbi:MAG TPA: glycosyltransferase family 2 protein [Vicinamibacterales bacterium]|nr:glycosyltransferase family 2 protein [Vicinamibacterales bacterium]